MSAMNHTALAQSLAVPEHSLLLGIKRGLAHRCPNCGQGRLFSRYLKVEHDCEVCGHELGAYPADDGPAYFTILLVGHLIVAPLLFFPFIWRWPVAVTLPLTLIPLAGLTLLLLPRIKGAFIGALWHLRLNKAEAAPGD
jgi:uncharacterized protein (DUF983 family)